MPFASLPQPFLRAEGLAHGVSGRRIDLALGRGDLTRVAAGVYAVASVWSDLAPWDRHLALARTAVRTTPDAIVSHASAAALLGLPMPPSPPQRATMTLLHDTRTSEDDGWRRFHRGRTPPEHIRLEGGHPYLVAARTVIDCVRDLAAGDALAVVDAALRRQLVSGPELVAMRRHQRRWPGVAAADEVLRRADGRRESWLESTSAWLMASWGVPPGIPQVVVRDTDDRFVARVDVLWPTLGLVGEADGRGKYLSADVATGSGGADTDNRDARAVAARAVVDQARRESRIRDLGLEVLRWDPDDLREPLTLLTRFRALAARGRPEIVTARYACSCCDRPLTDCGSPTTVAPVRDLGRG